MIHHLDLTVSDLERSLAFYDAMLDVLGYRRTHDYAGSVPVWVSVDAVAKTSIGLHRASVDAAHDRRAPGLHHVAFQVASRDDVHAAHRRALSIGAIVLDEPAEYDYAPGYYAVFFADPDGIKIEVVFEPAA
ncbi:catechol 2,3-dioxygenase-like lactoylglutathione lyase family enzyme [Dokdonella fugitiva]|uniref:Catechol 2,3-dioxygenase-like lactoylglutathione lyase family enzyme n=1 Tax=Dokdonella fugitiva TaxID=328517 RepID=A0A839FB03_9GAMM|nr:VOC family protein [Dokdonella fugitiva]MBA8889284.1 catechol 2,3-dioxygenase-like lactoylglutathione lyase family enzyme [Dokdonella fugitiva]